MTWFKPEEVEVRGNLMQTGKPETVTFVPVKFSTEEWDALKKRVPLTEEVAQFIHDTVMRSLRRKGRKSKKETP